MRILKHNLSNRKIAASLVAILLIGSVVGFILYKQGYFTKTPASTAINYGQPTTEQKNTGATTKQTVLDSTGKSAGTTDTPPTPTPISGSTKSTVQVSITASSQNGSLYQIRALIGALTNDGTCTLTLTQGSTIVTKTATTEALATTSTCRGFDIPVSQLATGQWQLNLSMSSPTLVGSTTSTITIQ